MPYLNTLRMLYIGGRGPQFGVGSSGAYGAAHGMQFGRGSKPNFGKVLVCQLCGRTGHVAIKCFKRFDIHFTGVETQSTGICCSCCTRI